MNEFKVSLALTCIPLSYRWSSRFTIFLLLSCYLFTSCFLILVKNINALLPISLSQLKRDEDPLVGVTAVILSEKEGAPGNLISKVEGVEWRFSESDASGVVVEFQRDGKPVNMPKVIVKAELFLPNKVKWPIRRSYGRGSIAVFCIPNGYDETPKSMRLVLSTSSAPNRILADLTITKFAPANTVIKPSEHKMAENRWKIIPMENLGAELQLIKHIPKTRSVVEVLRTTHVDYRNQHAKVGGRSYFRTVGPNGDLLKTWTTFEAGMREIELAETVAVPIHSTDTAIVKGLYLEKVNGQLALSIPRTITVTTKEGNSFEILSQSVGHFRPGQVKSRNVQLRAKLNLFNERMLWYHDNAKFITTIPPLGDFGIDSLKITMETFSRKRDGSTLLPKSLTSFQKENVSFKLANKTKLGALPPIKFVFDLQTWKKIRTYKGIVSVDGWPKIVER